jgi:hypothetical protein
METLFVANTRQKVLFDWEISGQLSDGYWENTRPMNHWRIWSRCEVVVASEPTKIGRNFRPDKSNYNLLAPMLLEAVGDRMITYAKIAKALGNEFDTFFAPLKQQEPRSIEYFLTKDFEVTEPKYDGKYWDEMRLAFKVLDLEKWLLIAEPQLTTKPICATICVG